MRTLLALLLLARAAGAVEPCPGDVNGDRRVTVAELVQAVNAALGGCDNAGPTPSRQPTATPTPHLTGCPVRFTDDNTADEDASCEFGTHLPANCGPLRFYSNGAVVILVTDTASGLVYYGCTADSATHATVFGRWTMQDVSDFTTTSGAIALSANGGTLSDGLAGRPACGYYDAGYTQRRFPARSEIRAMLAILGTR